MKSRGLRAAALAIVLTQLEALLYIRMFQHRQGLHASNQGRPEISANRSGRTLSGALA